MTTSTTTPSPQEAFAAYREAQIQAANLPEDRGLNHIGRIQAKAAILRPAREALAAAIASLAPADEATDPVAPVLDARRARSGDEERLHARQREIVQAQMASGKSLAKIIDQADEMRLAAILSGLDDDPAVLASSEPEAVAAEVRERVFDRLVALGAEDAVAANAQVREAQGTAAWHAVLTELRTNQGVPMSARSALHAADPEGYKAAISRDTDRPLGENIVHLDREASRILAAADNLGDA